MERVKVFIKQYVAFSDGTMKAVDEDVNAYLFHNIG